MSTIKTKILGAALLASFFCTWNVQAATPSQIDEKLRKHTEECRKKLGAQALNMSRLIGCVSDLRGVLTPEEERQLAAENKRRQEEEKEKIREEHERDALNSMALF